MVNIGIVGASGYTGIELLRILAAHSEANVTVITSSQNKGLLVADVFPIFRDIYPLKFSSHEDDRLQDCDLIFFATPHALSMNLVMPLLERGVRIIDLSADFRLNDVACWEQWYKIKHACPDVLKTAVYGLPEINREAIKNAPLIANPGCYPTAVSLGLIPLLKEKAIHLSGIVADAKSGVSGAGRKAITSSLYAEVSENFKAYSVGGHRHLPEIKQTLEWVAGEKVEIDFVPHLLPTIRGILATLYVELQHVQSNVQGLFEQYYSDEPYVDVMPYSIMPDTASVRGSNHCRIGIYHQSGSHRVIIISVIDNLVKGAAGQAIQNMNIACGFSETMGLDTCCIFP